MKINRVILKNYAQHRDLDITIDNDFVGIVGENGSGKSNFINSISDGITGDFHKKKDKIITYGEKTGEITINGEIDGKELVINRSLSGSGATMAIGDQNFQGADLVNSTLFELLECDKTFMSNMVFVKQEDVLGILFGRPSEKNRLLQKFFGLEKAQKIEAALTSWGSNLPELVEIDEKTIKNELTHAEVEVSSLKSNLAKLEQEKLEIEETLEDSEEIYQKIEKLYLKARKLESLKQEEKEVVSEIEKIKARIKNLEKPEFSREEIEKIKAKLQELKELIRSTTELINFIEGQNQMENTPHVDCPVCGSELSESKKLEITEKVEKLRSQVNKQKKEEEQLRLEFSEKSEKLKAYEAEEAKITKRLGSLEERRLEVLNQIEANKTKKSSEEYLSALNQIKESQKLEYAINGNIKLVSEAIETQNKIIERCKVALIASSKIAKENKATKIHKARIQRLQKLFRYNGEATELYVNSRIKKMCSTMNNYLEGFSAPFKVLVGNANEFFAKFGDKTIQSSELSGGQKVILSMAFRLAASELFTSKANLIVLDEPTTWLDRKRIDCFGEVLAEVKKMSEKRNLQVFIVTHEKSLIPHFNQVINFE